MNLGGIKQFLFRHVEKIILGGVLVFVCYGIYRNLFPPVATITGQPVGFGPPISKPTDAIRSSFRETAAPFIDIPTIAKARYNWFYPPDTRWGRRTELEMGRDPEARIPVGAKVVGTPSVIPLTEEELKERNLPAPDAELTEPCKLSVAVEPGTGKGGDTLLVRAVEPGRWVKVIAVLENQDRFCVAILVNRQGVRRGYELAVGVIAQKEIKEDPLGTVVLRFTAEQGTKKSADGLTMTTWVEPTYYEILRKSELDPTEVVVGKIPGRLPPKSAEPGGTTNQPPTKGVDSSGFPGAKRPSPPKEGLPPGKGEPPRLGDELVFRDNDVEAETTYTYRVRSVLIPTEETPPLKETTRVGPPAEYRTLEKFSFAFVGGDANKASIAVFIGPREKPLGVKIFERIPVGGWVGNVPKEFRPPGESLAPKSVGDKEGEPKPAMPKTAELSGSEPPGSGVGAPTAAETEEEPPTRYVTRHILVDVEMDILRLVEQVVNQPDGVDELGKPKFKRVVTYLEKTDRRAILRDRRNRLHYLWLEPRSAIPTGPTPAEKGKSRQ